MNRSRWKIIKEKNSLTGYLDKDGYDICLGDTVSYRRKVRAKWGEPGHYKIIWAKVVGFGTIVKPHWKGYPVQLDYIQLKENKSYNTFRIYCFDKLQIVIQKENNNFSI